MMLRIRRAIRLGKPLNRSSNLPVKRSAIPLSKQSLRHVLHLIGPKLASLLFAGVGSGVARAQRTIDFSGAQTFRNLQDNRRYTRLPRRGQGNDGANQDDIQKDHEHFDVLSRPAPTTCPQPLRFILSSSLSSILLSTRVRRFCCAYPRDEPSDA